MELSRASSLKYISNVASRNRINAGVRYPEQQIFLNLKIPSQFFCFATQKWKCHTLAIGLSSAAYPSTLANDCFDQFLNNFEKVSVLRLNDYSFSLSQLSFPFHHLQELSLFHCDHITNEDLRFVKEIRSVRLTNCELISDVSALSKCERLLLGSLRLLQDISCLKNVRHLTLFNCQQITHVQGLDQLRDLTILTCDQIVDISSLQNIKTVAITDSYSIELFPVRIAVGARRFSFSLFRPKNGTNMQLDPFANVQMLDFTYVDNIAFFCTKRFHWIRLRRSVHPLIMILGGCIQKLLIDNCNQAHITNNACLENCQVSHCDEFRFVSLAESRVTEISIDHCHGVDFSVEQAAIAKLSITDCMKMRNLDALGVIDTLEMKDCLTVRKLPKVDAVKHLRLLNCPLLTSTTDFSFLTSLEITNCPKVKSLTAAKDDEKNVARKTRSFRRSTSNK